MWGVYGLFENDLWFKNTSGVLSWKFFCPGHSLLNPPVVCSLHCISWSYFRNLYGKLHASMEPRSCSIFPSVKIKWNRQKRDKYIVGDHESQLLYLFPCSPPAFMLHWFFPVFPLLSPLLLDQAREQWDGRGVRGEGNECGGSSWSYFSVGWSIHQLFTVYS